MLRIIRDTREKEGVWDFGSADVIVKKLDTGDYTLEGMEDKLCIERKKTTGEIATNLGTDFERFQKELVRMKDFKFAYLILEFSVQDLLDYPKGVKLSPEKIAKLKMNGKYMVKLLSSFNKDYGIEVIYAGNRDNAIAYVEALFENVQKI